MDHFTILLCVQNKKTQFLPLNKTKLHLVYQNRVWSKWRYSMIIIVRIFHQISRISKNSLIIKSYRFIPNSDCSFSAVWPGEKNQRSILCWIENTKSLVLWLDYSKIKLFKFCKTLSCKITTSFHTYFSLSIWQNHSSNWKESKGKWYRVLLGLHYCKGLASDWFLTD